ncbi:hypothetical protein KA082_01650 [Candidatus Woesebacteria bacterium]|nr:hypothetical protein [Candidatus Woesebacteria bacterium]
MFHKLQKLAVSGAGIAAIALTASQAFAGGVGTITVGTGWATNFGALISFVLTLVMVIALLLVLLYLIMGGIEWITSGGDKGKTEAARNKITAAIIGIIILASAYALVQLVAYVLGFASFEDAVTNIPKITPAK